MKQVHFIWIFILILFISFIKISSKPFKRIVLSGVAQGTTWHITYFAADSLVTKNQVDSILLVIDSSMSIYKPYSRIVAFNNSKRGVILDEHFKKHVKTFDGITGRIILHEYDHIEGKLFIDYLPALKRKLLKRKLDDISKGKVSVDYKMSFSYK